MSKLELWEFLKEDGNWHKAADLRERFNIRQQTTLKNWTDVPFIMSYVSNKGKVYRFNKQFADAYDKAIEAEVYVPPIKLKSGKEIPVEIPDEEPEYFTIKFPILKSEVAKVANKEMKGLAKLGPEWNWAKQAIVELNDVKYSTDIPSPKAVTEVLIVALSAVIGYNGYNFEGVEALRESLKSPVGEMDIDDIRKAELDDILKRVPKNAEEIDYEAFFNE